MPLISAAKLSGIINRLGEVPMLCAIRSATGMKMAVTALELIVAPKPQTTSIKSISSRVSLLPAFAASQSPSRRATPVRTNPSPTTNRAAIKTTFESLTPVSTSPMVMTPVNGRATSIMSATASIRALLSANITIAAHNKPRTSASFSAHELPSNARRDSIRRYVRVYSARPRKRQ